MVADPLHGADRLLPVAHAEGHAADEAAADQARVQAVQRLGRHRRRRRGQARARGGRRVPARPASASRRSAPGCRRGSCCTGRPAPARRCWPRPWPTSRARTSSPSRRRRSSRCSPASARAHPAPVPRGAQERPGDHLHRRARRRRRPARQRHHRRAATRPSTSSWSRWTASRTTRRRRRHRRLEPAREARPRAAAPGALRPPDLRRAARREGARGHPARSTRATSRCDDVDLELVATPDQRAHRRRPGQHLQRGRDLRRAPRRRRASSKGDFDSGAGARRGRHAVAAQAQRPRAPRGRLPRGRPRARAASCCPRSTACTRSRSSRAGARWATR